MKFPAFCIFLLLWALPACAQGKLKLAVIMSAEQPRLEATQEKILRNLKQQGIPLQSALFQIDEETKDNHAQTQSLLRYDPDACLTLGSWPTAFACEHFKQKPIIFSFVYRIHAFDDLLSQNPNLRGVFCHLPMRTPFGLLKKSLPGLRKIGLLYTERFFDNRIAQWDESARQNGLELVAIPMKTQKDFPKSLEALSTDIQAFYFLPDPIMMQGLLMEKLFLESAEKGFVVFGEYFKLIEKGGLLVFQQTEQNLIEQTSEMLSEYASHRDLSKMQNREPDKIRCVWNGRLMKQMGMTLPSN